MSVPTNIPAGLKRRVKRGDSWEGLTVTYTKTGLNFALATVRSQLRSDSEGPLVVPVPVTVTSALVGSLACGLSLSAAATAALPDGIYYGDVELTHPTLGVKTAVTYELTVEGDFTQ